MLIDITCHGCGCTGFRRGCWRKGWRHDGMNVYHVAAENRTVK